MTNPAQAPPLSPASAPLPEPKLPMNASNQTKPPSAASPTPVESEPSPLPNPQQVGDEVDHAFDVLPVLGDVPGRGRVWNPLAEREGTEPQINPDDLIAADVEMQEMRVDEEVDDTLGFWQLDKTDKFICGGIVCLVIALIIILVLAMT